MPSLDSYYQPDFSHRNNKPKASTPSTAPQYSIGLDGVPTRTSGNPVSPTGGVMGGLPTDYKATEASAFASAARHRGVMADIRGGGGDTSSGRKPMPRQILPTQEVRKNENGVVSTGKNLSGGVSAAFVPEYANSSFNQLLAGVDTSGYQPFSSNQLPTTASNPFSGEAPKTDSFNPAAPGITGATYDNYGAAGGVAAASSTDKSEFTPMSGKESRIEGGSDRKKGGSLADALNDTAGINSYMSKFSSGDQERLANRAFLDTEGSMAGLRAKEAVNGVVYAGGQHYVAGKSGDDKAVAIDRSAARDISNGNETSAGASQKAQDLLAKKTGEIVAATKQAPTVLEDGAKDGAFKQDKPMFSGSTPAIGGAVEFDNNNDKTLPTFGNNGGYKSGFKKIDTTMTNPFG